MKVEKLGNKKKGLITKTWERCKSIGRGGGGGNTSLMALPLPITSKTTRRSKSWPSGLRVQDDEEKKSGKKKKGCCSSVAPEGCFSVYVGQHMQRFVIKTEYTNHPLFKLLLEEAESEYGYNSQGPLALPCNVDIFCKVLMEIEEDDDNNQKKGNTTRQGCASFGKRSKSHSTYRRHLLTTPDSGNIPLMNHL